VTIPLASSSTCLILAWVLAAAAHYIKNVANSLRVDSIYKSYIAAEAHVRSLVLYRNKLA